MFRALLSSSLLLAATFTTCVSQDTGSNGLVTGKLGNATVIEDNPEGVAFLATFPKKQFTPTPSGHIKGVVLAQTNEGGVGVTYSIKMENLPDEGGPFVYHIHQKAVDKEGNCTSTAAHLDPFERGETPPCNPALPQTCQVGDLAGKHGAIVTTKDDTTFSTTYTDDFTATDDGQSFIGNLSVVLHFANRTRITCANFVKMDMESMIMATLDDLLDLADSSDADDSDMDGPDADSPT